MAKFMFLASIGIIIGSTIQVIVAINHGRFVLALVGVICFGIALNCAFANWEMIRRR